MAKRPLFGTTALIESEITDTMLAGLKQFRPDLHYPESHSDMQACIRALLQVYEVRRRPLPEPLKYICDACAGIGDHIQPGSTSLCRVSKTCPECRGRGWTH